MSVENKEGEAVDKEVQTNTNLEKPNNIVEDHTPDTVITRERINDKKDKKEEETGEFHWRFEDGELVPVSDMNERELRKAIELCEGRLEDHHEEVEFHKGQVEYHVDHMCSWQHRAEKLEEEIDNRNLDEDTDQSEIVAEDEPEGKEKEESSQPTKG